MAVLNPNWYSASNLRGYPVSDAASREDDEGVTLPADLLLDLSIRFPDDLGTYAYLGAASRTAGAVTVVILSSHAQDSADSPVLLASCTIPIGKLRAGRIVPLVPLADGVSGWVVFGPGAPVSYHGRFSSPTQSLLGLRSARPYKRPPVLSAAKENTKDPFVGIVSLRGSGNVEVVSGVRHIDGQDRTVVILRLKGVSGTNANDLYRGPCGTRPETGNCAATPLESINNVSPDCNGNITIQFLGGLVASEVDAGIVVDFHLGLDEACAGLKRLPDSAGNLPGTEPDECGAPYYSSDDDGGVDGDDSQDSSTVSMGSIDCGSLPIDMDGDLSTSFDEFRVESGIFETRTDYNSSSVIDPSEFLYEADGSGGRGVAVVGSCGSSMGKVVSCTMSFPDGTGTAGPAGLVVNWHLAGAALTEQYFFAAIDISRSSAYILFWNGNRFITIGDAEFLSTLDYWHEYLLTVRVTLAPDYRARLEFTVVGLNDATDVTITTDTYRYNPSDGDFGVGTSEVTADFETFTLDNL